MTQMRSYEGFKNYQDKLEELKDELNLKNIDMIHDRIVQMKNENASLNRELKSIKEKLLNEEANSLIQKAKDNGSYRYLLLKLDQYSGNLKDYVSGIRNKLNGGFVFVVNSNGERLSMAAAAGNAFSRIAPSWISRLVRAFRSFTRSRAWASSNRCRAWINSFSLSGILPSPSLIENRRIPGIPLVSVQRDLVSAR
jgi:alanyl-tRNA synthetase